MGGASSSADEESGVRRAHRNLDGPRAFGRGHDIDDVHTEVIDASTSFFLRWCLTSKGTAPHPKDDTRVSGVIANNRPIATTARRRIGDCLSLVGDGSAAS
jgi:hypothetical protein